MPETELEERPKREQGRIDGTTKDEAWSEWKDQAADYAEKSQRWKDLQDLRDVRLDDLVKAHDNGVLDDERAKVSAAAAKAVKREKSALQARQEAKKKLDLAWDTVQSFEEHEQPMPLIEPAQEPEKASEKGKGRKKKGKA